MNQARLVTGRRFSRNTWGPKLLAALVFLVLLPYGLGNGCAPREATPEVPIVLVTIPPLEFFVRQLAGNAVEVRCLLPPGADPHGYEPGVSQLRALESASLIVTVGHPALSFERAIIDRLPGAAASNVVVGFAGALDTPDPHVWLSPDRCRTLSRNLSERLSATWPSLAPTISERADSLDGAITRLDHRIRSVLSQDQGGAFLVVHDAWGPFADAYGLEQIAIEEDGHEPGPERIAAILSRARATHLGAVFVEPQFSRQSAELIASEIGAEVVVLDPLSTDWSDNLIKAAEAIAAAGTTPAPTATPQNGTTDPKSGTL